jgi:hypothetical protein
MKRLFFLFLLVNTISFHSQEIPEKEIKTKVQEVVIFLKDAQITRNKTVALPKGTSIVKFVNLSPFINPKSIQLRGNDQITVLSVNHQQNFLEKSKKSMELEGLEEQLQDLQDKMELEQTYLLIINEKLSFFEENKDVGGKNQSVSVTNLQQTAEYYSTQITKLRLENIERKKNIEELSSRMEDLNKQINTLQSKREYPSGEILITIDSKSAVSVPLELSYVVKNASWFPTYDIRAKNIQDPVNLIYKANVRQDTKIDWNDAKITLSTADPNISGVAPKLRTYFLDYNSKPPVYGSLDKSNIVGIVLDEQGQPLPGVTVIVKGTTIGTQTNFDGQFSLTMPQDGGVLSFSYIGMKTRDIVPDYDPMTVVLEEDIAALEEVVVVGYGSKGRSRTSKLTDKSNVAMEIEPAGSISTIELSQSENQTSVSFEIEHPYTIKSDNQNYSVDMESYELPAFYQYYAVPKINDSAYLIANISDWEKYNLLEGEANVFFEETYVGKTLLDVRYASDTLQISLGRDKKVSLKREKLKDYTTKQFIGNKKEETRAYQTQIKNNKKETINMIVLDQIPVSRLEEIEVKILEVSKGRVQKESGEVKWELSISPSDSKELKLQYSVKYPKDRSLIIE